MFAEVIGYTKDKYEYELYRYAQLRAPQQAEEHGPRWSAYLLDFRLAD